MSRTWILWPQQRGAKARKCPSAEEDDIVAAGCIMTDFAMQTPYFRLA